MKKNLLIIAMAMGLVLTASAQEHKNVLWIGNSYAEVNNLPSLTQKIAESMGDRLEYTANTPGGCTFEGHCRNNSMTLIQRGGWDVVVLQGQSQEPSFPQSQVENETFPYAQQLVEAVYQYNDSTVEPMFYMTWGRKNGDSYNAQFYPPLGTYEGMDSLLYERYLYMARTFDASVCPVGRVWHRVRDNHPELELYQQDNSHPTMLGSYAAACSFYVMLFGNDPRGITYIDTTLSESDCRIIRDVVKNVVYDSLTFWQRQQDTIPTPPPVCIDPIGSSHQMNTITGPYVVYNLMGRPVWRGEAAEQFDIRTTVLPRGIYLLRSNRYGCCRKVVK